MLWRIVALLLQTKEEIVWYNKLMPKLYTNKGREIIHSPQDYPLLKEFYWEEGMDSNGKRLSNIRRRFTVNGKRKQQSIARFLLGDEHESIDHIDRNPLNNKRENLRICTHQENCRNRNRKDTIGYRGVYLEKRKLSRKSGKAYRAIVVHNKKSYYAGYFKTEKEAALAYNTLAKELHGEFAHQNKVPKKK